MIFENSPLPYFWVPLNIMCSSRFDRPARPITSLRDPTLYQICTVITGAFGSSTRRTFMSLARVNSWMFRLAAITGCAKTDESIASAMPRSQFTFIILDSSLCGDSLATESAASVPSRTSRRLKEHGGCRAVAELPTGPQDTTPFTLSNKGIKTVRGEHL